LRATGSTDPRRVAIRAGRPSIPGQRPRRLPSLASAFGPGCADDMHVSADDLRADDFRAESGC
jgi:hypothetical protein